MSNFFGGKEGRRHFFQAAGLLVVGSALAPAFISSLFPRAAETADLLARDQILSDARRYLIAHEDIPPGIKNVPDSNEHFRYADDTLQRAIDIYQQRRVTENDLPAPYYRKSQAYLSDLGAFEKTAVAGKDTYINAMSDLFQGGPANEFLKRYKKNYSDFFMLWKNLVEARVDENPTFGPSPFLFDATDFWGASDIISKNPGSAILNRVCQNLNIKNDDDISNHDEGELVEALHKEIDPIWAIVDNYVSKNKKPMSLDVFLGELLYRNKGDITGSLWDAEFLTKLIRDDPVNLRSYFLSEDNPVGLEKEATNLMLSRLEDQSAPRISANWVNTHVTDSRLFNYDSQSDPYIKVSNISSKKNYKPFDKYGAVGDIYNRFGIMALPTATTPEIVQMMTLGQCFFYVEDGKINSDSGLEKAMANLLVGYRAPQIRDILDKYK